MGVDGNYWVARELEQAEKKAPMREHSKSLRLRVTSGPGYVRSRVFLSSAPPVCTSAFRRACSFAVLGINRGRALPDAEKYVQGRDVVEDWKICLVTERGGEGWFHVGDELEMRAR